MNDHITETQDNEVQDGLLSAKNVESTAREVKVPQSVPFLCSQRWIFTYLLFYFGFLISILRVNMSLTLPYMVKSVDVNSTTDHVTGLPLTSNSTNTTTSDECYGKLQTELSMQSAEFKWRKFTQSMILAAYFWGYIVTQIPGGWVSGKFGGKRVVTVCMALSSGVTLVTPVLARASPYALMIDRFLIGLLAGVSFPAAFNLVGLWSLPHERSRIVSMLMIGNGAGIVVGILTSGILCDKGFDNGWASVFYVHGICFVPFFILWVCCVADSPLQHTRIADAEKDLFRTHKTDGTKNQPVPWKKLLTHIPVGVVCATHAIENFTLYLLMLCLPLFLKEVMKFDIQNNSLFFSLPFVTNMLGMCVAGALADCLISIKLLSRSAIRKFFQCTGLLGMGAMIIIPGYLDCSQYILVIVCFSTSTLFGALGQTAGYGSNIVDIAPRYASVTFGISNTFATIPGMVAPLIVAELTPNGTMAEWRTVFYIAAISLLVGVVLFGCFSSSETAPWAQENPVEFTVTADGGDIVCQKLDRELASECV